MDPQEIEQLLKEADQRTAVRGSDPQLLADRVMHTIRRRRATRAVASLMIFGGLIGVMLANLPEPIPAPQIALQPKPPLERRAQEELASIQNEIAIREAALARLEAMERRSRLAAKLAAIPTTPPVDQLVERAAATVVYQADRMMQSGADPQPAIQAYHEVIAHFPQANSAQTARQRVAQFNKAG